MALQIKDLTVGYNNVPIIAPFSITVPEATFNIIVGANGAGKSTLMQTIAGNLRPIQGNIIVNDLDISNMSHRKRARLLSFVNTSSNFNYGLTVCELVEMGRHPHNGFLGRLSAKDKAAVSKAMADVGISHKAETPLCELSDGERQKALVARALAQQTPIMLLDEPTNYLDAASRLEMLTLIRNLVNKHSLIVLMSTHDTADALAVADNILTVVNNGSLCNSSTTSSAIPTDLADISFDKANSPTAIKRLNDLYSHRGISYNPTTHSFQYKGND